MDLTWPNPISELAAYRELVEQPGVYVVTTDLPTTSDAKQTHVANIRCKQTLLEGMTNH